MKPRRLVVLVCALACGCGPGAQPARPVYDYSTPAQSFRSLQQAFRARDVAGIAIHMQKTMKLTAKAGGGDPEEVDRMFDRQRDEDAWLGCDTSVVEFSPLKLSDATVVEVGPFKADGSLLCARLTLRWPGGEEADDVLVTSGDNGKTWWCGLVFITGVHP